MVEDCVEEVLSKEESLREISRISEAYLRLLMRRNPWNVIVMDFDGYLIGFILSSDSSNSQEKILEWLYVIPDFRKTNTAVKACRAYIDAMVECKIPRLIAFTTENNRSVLSLCRRFGINVEKNLTLHLPKSSWVDDGLILSLEINR